MGKLFLFYVMHLWNVQWSARSKIALVMHNRYAHNRWYMRVYLYLDQTGKMSPDML
jgi:hypothetical protein